VADFPDLSILARLSPDDAEEQLNRWFQDQWRTSGLSGSPQTIYLTAFNFKRAPDTVREIQGKLNANLKSLGLDPLELDPRRAQPYGGLSDQQDDQIRAAGASVIGALLLDGIPLMLDGVRLRFA
jgi:hypothetical protein